MRRLTVAAALTVLLVLQQNVMFGGQSLMAMAIHDSLHIPWFAVVTIGVTLLLPKFNFWAALAVCVCLACATEALQLLSARQASAADVLRNLWGSALILGIGFIGQGRVRNSWQPANWSVAQKTTGVILVLASLAVMPGRILLGERYRDAIAPRIVDGADWRLMPRLEADRPIRRTAAPEDWADPGATKVLAVPFPPGNFPELTIKEVPPDWRGFSELVVRVYWDGDHAAPLMVGVALKGQLDLNHVLKGSLAPGANTLRYSVEMLIEPSDETAKNASVEVDRLLLFTDRYGSGHTLYVWRIELIGSLSGNP